MFTFVANLKPYTFYRGRGIRRFGAYLLSVDFGGGANGELAREVGRDDAVLCADNGNVDAIRELIAAFGPRAEPLHERRKREEARLGGYARPGELSTELSTAYQLLAEEVRDASAAVTTEAYVRAAVARQRAMQASYAIGMEDFTTAALTGLSVEPEYSGLAPSFYAALNRRAVDFAVATREGRFGEPPAHVFAGVHALDYDQAVDAGRMVGEAGIEGVATGLVGALRDRNSVDFRVQEGSLIDMGETVARPYMRVLEIAAGLHVGYHAATGRRPQFHALGAGAPILLPLLGLLGDEQSYTSTDSTAPIVDGWSGPTVSLYVDDPAPLKLRAEKIAASWLAGGRGWDCDCAYCRAFEQRHPSRVVRATQWWSAAGKPRIRREHLHRSGPLAPLLPYLAQHPDDAIRREAGLARVGHNHQILQRLEYSVRRALTSGRVEDVMDRVAAYISGPGLERWRASARQALRIATDARTSLGDRVHHRETP